MTIPLAPVLGLVAGLSDPINYAMAGDYTNAINVACMNYTGYHPGNKTFDLQRAQVGLAPLIIGALVHKFVGGAPLNLNRMLAAANVPVLRI